MAARRVVNKPVEDIGDFDLAQARRREAVQALTISERLARAHALNKQMSALKGAAAHR
jgi:hypothetical protein